MYTSVALFIYYSRKQNYLMTMTCYYNLIYLRSVMTRGIRGAGQYSAVGNRRHIKPN